MRFDLDGNGQITLDELREVLGGDEDDEDIKQLISQVDKDGDGQINFDEFKDMMVTLYRRNSMITESNSSLINLGIAGLFEERRVSMFT